MRLFFTFLFALLSVGCAFGQLGCTEPCATNYNPDATVDDGSCELPEAPALECWETAIFNDDPAVCAWEITGETPDEPSLACYETATFNNTTCQWELSSEHPPEPILECYEIATFNLDPAVCDWEVFGEMPEIDDNCDLTDDSFDESTCTAVNTPNCPDGTGFDATNCDCVIDAIGGCTDVCATNYDPNATVDDGSCELPEEPTLECWETATFNDFTCLWEVAGDYPAEPSINCWQTATFNNIICQWVITGEMPEIDDACELTEDSFDEVTCTVIHESNCPIGMILDAENCECVVYGGIQNFTFYDTNQNQIQDNDEPLMSDIPLMLNSNNLNIYTSNNNLYLLEPGNYTVSIDMNTEWILTTDSASYFITVNVNDTIPVNFGLYPNELVSDVQTAVYALWPRCNELYTIDVITKNLGTTVISGTTWLQIDSAIIDFSFINEPDVIDNSTMPISYGWNFTNLSPYESITWQVEILVPGPPEFAVGDFLLLPSLTEYTDANGTHIEEGFTCGGEVRCSYDPNDKLVNPNRPYDEVLFGEDFIYTIRFQNTGNDVAYDITILDTLDANLDWETFRVLGSSHSEVLNTSLDDEGIIAFDFRNIFLPDSTSNLEGSNGYVTYMIDALEGLDENTVIRNSAGIYFDQNPPIITNTTESVMVSMLTTSTTTPDDLFPNLTILPNPNRGTFQVEGVPSGAYHLLNTKGQIIQSGKLENGTLIDISEAAQGVYFIQMIVDGRMLTRRLVKL